MRKINVNLLQNSQSRQTAVMGWLFSRNYDFHCKVFTLLLFNSNFNISAFLFIIFNLLLFSCCFSVVDFQLLLFPFQFSTVKIQFLHFCFSDYNFLLSNSNFHTSAFQIPNFQVSTVKLQLSRFYFSDSNFSSFHCQNPTFTFLL